MREKIPEIKICGLTKREEVKDLIDNQVNYAGIVLYYKKSRRYNDIENAEKIVKEIKKYKSQIKSVAVVVSPTKEQIEEIEKIGFDYIQIHGEFTREAEEAVHLPVFLAFNVSKDICFKEASSDRVFGYVLDGEVPGGGKTFEWSRVRDLFYGGKKFILAGGLNTDNVRAAIDMLNPDIVDVSSGVERKGAGGKDGDKIREFVRKVRENE